MLCCLPKSLEGLKKWVKFLQILIFHYYENGNTHIKKLTTKVVVSTLREPRLTMTNQNVDKRN